MFWIFILFFICFLLVPVPVIIDWAQIQGKQFSSNLINLQFQGGKYKQNVLNECSVYRILCNDLLLYIAV